MNFQFLVFLVICFCSKCSRVVLRDFCLVTKCNCHFTAMELHNKGNFSSEIRYFFENDQVKLFSLDIYFPNGKFIDTLKSKKTEFLSTNLDDIAEKYK